MRRITEKEQSSLVTNMIMCHYAAFVNQVNA